MKTKILNIFIAALMAFPVTMARADVMSDDKKIIHVLNRLGYGPRPGDVERVRAMGIYNYIFQQLHPAQIVDDPRVAAELSGLKTHNLNTDELWKAYGPIDGLSHRDPKQVERRAQARIILSDARNERMIRALYSSKQLQELLVDFWYNHFNICFKKGNDTYWMGSFEREAIRPHVLGRFRDMLGAVAKHPAMLEYLDNQGNLVPISKRKTFVLNENYARELMELHTLGVNNGYTQADIISLAGILSGWTYPKKNPDGTSVYTFYFNGHQHLSGDKPFLGTVIKSGGQDEGEQALDILASNPATAKFISYKLAQFFIADNPDTKTVEKMANRFMLTGGDLRAVLRVLLRSDAFWNSSNYNNKFKTPFQYMMSSLRAVDRPIEAYQRLSNKLNLYGMPLYDYATPDGYKYTTDAWLSGYNMMQRVDFAADVAQYVLIKETAGQPLTAEPLVKTMNNMFSKTTMDAVNSANDGKFSYKVMLLLGSPEMLNK